MSPLDVLVLASSLAVIALVVLTASATQRRTQASLALLVVSSLLVLGSFVSLALR